MNCTLCPRKCNVPRDQLTHGYCGVPEQAMVCRAAPHYGEEPCISGTKGSGTVFFAGCNLRCVFCQNQEISRGIAGEKITTEKLREIFLSLQEMGVHNINLVTPTHFSMVIADALAGIKLEIPVVWNSSGYESVDTLKKMEGLVQVYMPDLKYADSRLAERYSSAADYPKVAVAAIQEMYRQTGPFEMDGEGILKRGLLIRHLILPGNPENTLRVIDAIEDNLPAKKILFSLMSQYTPMGELEKYPELQHKITQEEYDRCASYLDFSEIEFGYYQSPDSATEEMIPAFDGTGVK